MTTRDDAHTPPLVEAIVSAIDNHVPRYRRSGRFGEDIDGVECLCGWTDTGEKSIASHKTHWAEAVLAVVMSACPPCETCGGETMVGRDDANEPGQPTTKESR